MIKLRWDLLAKYASHGIPYCLGIAFLASGNSVAYTQTLSDSLKQGTPIFDFRYRFELVDQDSFTHKAVASTARTRLGYETQDFNGLKGLLEFENITAVDDDTYNSTTNGKVAFPIVADPESTEVNRAQISFKREATTATVGRQRISLANERFIGAVGFRQNEQTFDAVHLTNSSFPDLTLTYAYVFRVNRVFGGDHPLGRFKGDTHLLSASYTMSPIGNLTGYALFIDTENAALNSNRTLGMRLSGSRKAGGYTINYAAEFANQTDYERNPISYDLNYYFLEAGITAKRAGLKAGYETLEGDGRIGFATPLATLHKFQGFADVFLTTPVDGIADAYLTAEYTMPMETIVKNIRIAGAYHIFKSARGSENMGNEFDILVASDLQNGFTLELKFAAYEGNTFAADRQKFWGGLSYKF